MLSSILLAKLAHDAGFDVELGVDNGWLKFCLPGSKLLAWIKAADAGVLVALSRVDVLRELSEGKIWQGARPALAAGAREVSTGNDVIALLSRARVLDRTLPNALLEEYQAAVAGIDRTEAEAIAKQRRGQEVFRKGLMDYWQGRCAITGIAVQNSFVPVTSRRGLIARAMRSAWMSSMAFSLSRIWTRRSIRD
jgi:hypothetical protein